MPHSAHSGIAVKEILDVVRGGGGLMTLTPLIRHVVDNPVATEKDCQALLDIVHHDAAMSVAILRAANERSPSEGGILDIGAAANRVGYQMIRNLALTTGFVENDPRSDRSRRLYAAMQYNWERSLYHAVAARAMALEIDPVNHERYFTAGLMLHIGVILLLCQFSDRYLPVYEQWLSGGGELSLFEKDVLGVNHATVGQHLAKTWNLGIAIENGILEQHNHESVASDGIDIRIIHFAHLSASVFFEARNASGIERVNHYAAKAFGIPSNDLALILQRIAIEADKTSERFISGASGATSIELLRSINQELGRATLSYEQLVRELRAAMDKADALAHQLREANERLRKAAHIDALTRVYNRWYFDEFLQRDFERAGRYGSTLGCLMIDIDHFKLVNDTYGHLTGDRVLHGVAETLKKALRRSDVVARYGGEEFVVMLPDSNPIAVQMTAAKLHHAVAATPFPVDGKDLQVTISVGYFAYNKEERPELKGAEEIVQRADENMYEAKTHGRNQIWPPIIQG